MIDNKVQSQGWFIGQEGKGELQRGLLKQLKGKGETLLKSAVEATSLGLKTKSGLRPNC